MKTLILVNVGTPQSPEPHDVGVYLNEFLIDEDIISIPRPFRDILVKLIIVPRRKFTSSEKYKRIWTEQGSPLLIETQKLSQKLQSFLDKNAKEKWRVLIGMQIGEPRLKEILARTDAQDEIYFCPLYPQFAQATTGAAMKTLRGKKVHLLNPFYQESWFINPLVERIREHLKPEDHLLLSYHGLPISQLKKTVAHCYSSPDCCIRQESCEMNCYKAQCLKTSEQIRSALGLDSKKCSTSFQSRLGPTKWIEPSTEEVVDELLKKGVQNLVVACPSFVSDCLETLEEIGIDLKKQFLEKGGKTFKLVPCVNDDDNFVRGLAEHLSHM
jgi:ferrochelatase